MFSLIYLFHLMLIAYVIFLILLFLLLLFIYFYDQMHELLNQMLHFLNIIIISIGNLLVHVFSTYMNLRDCLTLAQHLRRCNILFSSLLVRFFDFMTELVRIFVILSCLISPAASLGMFINLESSSYSPH